MDVLILNGSVQTYTGVENFSVEVYHLTDQADGKIGFILFPVDCDKIRMTACGKHPTMLTFSARLIVAFAENPCRKFHCQRFLSDSLGAGQKIRMA